MNKKYLILVLIASIVVVVIGLGVGIWLISGGGRGGSGGEQSSSSAIALDVEVVKPTRNISNPTTEVTLKANQEIEIVPTPRVDLRKLGDVEGKAVYVAKLKNLGEGESTVRFKVRPASPGGSAEAGDPATSEKSAEAEKEILVTVTKASIAFPAGFTEVSGWPDSNYTLNGDAYDAVVNKQNRLLEDYEPSDLVDLNKEFGIYTLNSAQLRSPAASSLNAMLLDLRKATKESVTVASGYRSFETQVSTYSHWVRQVGEKRANDISARPGHSEHQLGTTVDFVNEATAWQINDKFGGTKAGKWLAANCQKYGFVQPYKSDQSQAGGYKEESWHFRYIGTE